MTAWTKNAAAPLNGATAGLISADDPFHALARAKGVDLAHGHLSVSEVAKLAELDPSNVRTRLKGGNLRGYQVGGTGPWRVAVNDVREWLFPQSRGG